MADHLSRCARQIGPTLKNCFFDEGEPTTGFEHVPPTLPVPGLLISLDPSEAVIATLEITGADRAGAPAQELRVALWNTPHRRYVDANVTSGDGVADPSALWGHFQIVS